jgi:pyruvate formate lyase activating enzyme
MQVNFGGFISLSTVDWPGRAVCTVFLRGCPLRCSYCQNAAIQDGTDIRETEEIEGMIRTALPLISGVVFSGGEPTMQPGPLGELAQAAKGMDLAVALQTNGYYPNTLEALLSRGLIDRVALDFKTRWEGFSARPEGYTAAVKASYPKEVSRSICICRAARDAGRLREFEVVVTLFPGNEAELAAIAKQAGDADLVLQQGEMKKFRGHWVTSGDIEGCSLWNERELRKERPPLTFDELVELAGSIRRTVKIRTREGGEVRYEGRWSRRASCKR